MKGAAAEAMVESLDETCAVSRAERAGSLATLEVEEMDGRTAPVEESRREADSGVVAVVVVVVLDVVRESGTEEMAEEEVLSLRCISGLSDISM